jgi:GTP-binding protein HflX
MGKTGGPGETQKELDRRMIDDKIKAIKKDLEQVVRNRAVQRAARERVPFPVIALVGYTNAGKSTLFNTLTNEKVFAKDLLFATLDTTLRALTLPSGRNIILSDTVGFISHLPTELVAAFRATLEETVHADIILHVRDIASVSTDAECADVVETLNRMSIEQKTPIWEVWNKIDLLSDPSFVMAASKRQEIPAFPLSALTGHGTEPLLQALDTYLSKNDIVQDITLSSTQGDALAWLYRHADILSREEENENIKLYVRISPAKQGQFNHLFLQQKEQVQS